MKTQVEQPIGTIEDSVTRAGYSSLLRSPHLLLTGSSLFWAGNFIVGRALRDDISPIALNFWRWALALLILLPLSLPYLRQHRALLRENWKLIVALAASGVAAFQTLVYFALTMTTAINGLLIMTLTPIAIVALAWLVFRDRLTRLQAVGVVVSLLGAITVISRGDLSRLLDTHFNPGDLWMAVAVVLWAIYSILLKRRPSSLPLLPLLTSTVIVGLLMLVPLYGIRLSQGERLALHTPTLLGLLYVGIFPSAVAFTFWNKGVIAVGPNIAGMFLHLMPVFGAILAVVFLDEQVALFHLVGALLVFAGIVLTSWHPSRASR